MHPRTLAAFAALAAAVAVLAVSASAGVAGRWTQITHQSNGSRANLGLARGKDGRLHVLWAGPARAPYKGIYDTTISPAGAVGNPQAVVSGWSGVNPPAAAAAPDGSIHALISGAKVGGQNDPTDGLNDATGPGPWHLGAHAFGHSPISVPSNAVISTAVLKNGQLVSVWQSAGKLLMQVGTDPAVAPQDITPPGLADSPQVAVDQASGDAVVAYHNVNAGQNSFRRLLPALGPQTPIPLAKLDSPQIAARTGGGVYTAYTPDGVRVLLLRFGGPSKAVPVPKGVHVLTAGVAPGPEGRLWVYFGSGEQTFVTRTSKAAGGFEPIQTLASPKNAQYFRLEGEGSAGPLDLFVDLTVDGQAKDGTYQTHVLPVLSLVVAKKAAKTGTRVTVRVLDAGDPIAGARVTGLPGGAKTTGATGSIVLPAARKGVYAVTATRAGYLSAKARVTL